MSERKYQFPCGVYEVYCTKTIDRYVGGTTHLARRERQHRSSLTQGSHRSKILQVLHDMYGMEAIQFRVLEYCEPDELAEREQHYLDTLKPSCNRAKLSTSTKGVKITEEQREHLKLRPQSQAVRYKVRGEMLSVPEMTKRYDLQAVTIRARLRRGVSGDELVAPLGIGEPGGRPAQKYDFEGTMLPMKEIARRLGVPLSTAYKRIRNYEHT